MTILWLLAFAGCSPPKYLEDLTTPALIWTQGNGLCSKIVAVDGGGTVWTNQGCEDGRPSLREGRSVNKAQADALWAAFDQLPLGQNATLDQCAGRLLHGFARWDANTRIEATACGSSPRYDDVSGLPDAFQTLAVALRDLE